MCRLIAYIGSEILLEDVLVKPVNSIIMQSLHARESEIPTNGDGFGLGWYAPHISPEPALFTSISPAWNDRNLLHLTAKIKSPALFAHVRAASAGGVTNYNCHPFVHDKWMFMHNGGIHDFITVKRHLRHLLEDDIYHWIQGETDSEHMFALFLQMAKGKDLSQLSVVADVLQAVFYQISELIRQFGKHGASYFNVCLTDGQRLLASRYCSYKSSRPSSMHYSIGSEFVARNGRYHMLQEKDKKRCILVTSEKLTRFNAEWQDVPENHLLMVDKDFSIQLRSL
ncbi:class II glutamine amidotransferase [Legionella oakridgensis]|uniref:Glutamine amidotransferase n=2 Tax=Legionella oakridgensis TaxID=29423 RepID=A0A0W0XGQ3_9GAMM|nr:class II glutamine amidotransferase [Legionella oakridgensis]AHE65930.1 putative glutamine amidotransferase [Legionella oakridgensis ATCC 33761 = DSM 21215]KTD43783.1 glutamine amidotransferase [Legionella oakridgensis]STY15861.1 glutamine amidotransferase [Legionella longbeachae]